MTSATRLALGTACVLAFLAAGSSAHAANYNVIVFEDFTGTNCDVEGALAAGGNITLSAYAVGAKLTAASDGENTLVAGKSIAFSNGQLYHGNAVAPVISGDAYVASGSKILASAIDFESLKQLYTTKSAVDAARTANGSVFNQYGTMTLTGGVSGMNVFDIAGADTGSVGLFNLDIPTNAYALINVIGSSASFMNIGFDVGSTSASHILFNFSDATSLSLGGIGFEGSILAPHADVSFDNGHLDGQLVARSMSGTGQINEVAPDFSPFASRTPFKASPATAAPEPGTWMMLIAGFGSIGMVMRRRSAAVWNRRSLAI
jgi:choice-of-anchor A domain-containing protein